MYVLLSKGMFSLPFNFLMCTIGYLCDFPLTITIIVPARFQPVKPSRGRRTGPKEAATSAEKETKAKARSNSRKAKAYKE